MATPAASATLLTFTVMIPVGRAALGVRVTVALATLYPILAGIGLLSGPVMTMLAEVRVLTSAPSLKVMVMGVGRSRRLRRELV